MALAENPHQYSILLSPLWWPILGASMKDSYQFAPVGGNSLLPEEDADTEHTDEKICGKLSWSSFTFVMRLIE